MSYSSIKNAFNLARKEQLSIDKDLKRISGELAGIDDEYAKLDSSYTSSYARFRSDALKRHRSECTSPYEEKLQKAETKLNQLISEYDEKGASISFENLMQECSNKQDILSDIRKHSTVLSEQLKRLVGNRFYSVIMQSLDSQEIDFNTENLDELIQYYNRSEKTLESFASNDSTFYTVVEAVEDSMGNDSGITTVIGTLVLALLLFLPTVVLPVVVFMLLVFAIFTVFRNYEVYHVLLVQKAVIDNIDKIDKHLKEQVEEELTNRRLELDNNYKPRIEKLKGLTEQLRSELQDVAANADNSFVFDDKEIELRKAADVEKIDKQRSALLVQQRQKKELLAEKTKIVEELGKQLNDLLSSLKDEFMSGIGKDVVFKPDFLFDIDTVKGKPIFFKHPQTSCLFLYTDTNDVYDFIRLISLELRAKLSPYNLNIITVDQRDMGQDLIYFTSSDEEEGATSAFSILTTDDDVKSLIKDTSTDLLRRQDNIRREFGTIEKYNEEMVRMNSLTELYEFQFIIDPSHSYLQSLDSQRCLRIGGSLGVFIHLFISKAKFSEMKETDAIMDAIGKVYYLEDGNYYERAKDFVIEDLLVTTE